jgi:predicted DNA-binding transcriptional regulator AlpA
MQDWTITIDVAGTTDVVDETTLERLADELHPYAASVHAHGAERYGATFCVEATSELDAAHQALEVFRKAGAAAMAPEWPVVLFEILDDDEAERQASAPIVPELVGVAEIAELVGVSRQRVSTLAQKHGFPAPVAVLAAGPVWTRSSIGHWVENWPRKAGRPPKVSA